MAITTLAKAKAFLNITVSDFDTELQEFIDAADSAVEFHVGKVVLAAFTDKFSGYGQCELVMRRLPVASITTVTEQGTTLLSTDYSLGDSGVLTRVAGYRSKPWRWGVNNISVTYQAGRATPYNANLIKAAEIITAHLWTTQRGSGSSATLVDSEEVQFISGLGYAIPRRAIELMAVDRILGVA